MNSDEPQVRTLLKVLAERISSSSDCSLSGQGIADALFGLSGMASDCPELRSLLSALADRIDATRGKLDSQEIGNALFGLQGLSSDTKEVRVIVSKLAEKIKRSKAVLRAPHIGRALCGMQGFSAESPEVRMLLRQLTKRIDESERTRLTGEAIADALFGLQGFTSDIQEVQDLAGALAKKIAFTNAQLTSSQLGRALFGLQGLSTAGSIFLESVIGIDSDEVQFLLSTLWDKVKVRQERMELRDIAQGLLGITLLKDPIGNNLRQYMYLQLVRLGLESGADSSAGQSIIGTATETAAEGVDGTEQGSSVQERQQLEQQQGQQLHTEPMDVVLAVRALRLNQLKVPKWLATEYNNIEAQQAVGKTVVTLSRSDKLVTQRYTLLHPDEEKAGAVRVNSLLDGFRMDFEFPLLKLNVQLDGPRHRYPSRARYDRERDEYIENKGYKVGGSVY